MCIAMLVAIFAFSAAAENAISPIKNCIKFIYPLNIPEGPLANGELLWHRLLKIRLFVVLDVSIQFVALNLVGILASRFFFIHTDSTTEEWWGWMDSWYWSVQTTTTIGYGDYTIPYTMRWFQIFYLMLSTFFVGQLLGRLGGLKSTLEEQRRFHAWEKLDVNKHMMYYFSGSDNPVKVDQYEFVLASLLNLGKISPADIEPITDKFKLLVKDSGHDSYIRISDVPEEGVLSEEPKE